MNVFEPHAFLNRWVTLKPSPELGILYYIMSNISI